MVENFHVLSNGCLGKPYSVTFAWSKYGNSWASCNYSIEQTLFSLGSLISSISIQYFYLLKI